MTIPYIIGVLWEPPKAGISLRKSSIFSYHLNKEDKDAFIAEHQSKDLIPSERDYRCMGEDWEIDILKKSKNGIWEYELIPPQ